MARNKKARFRGDEKKGKSLLWGPETRLKDFLVPLVPRFIETNHLTMTTVLWSIGVIIFSFLANINIHWLWGASAMIFCQYITDLLDGEIGRRRNTGLIKWGFYMDHFLDYIFLCSIIIGYTLLMPGVYAYTLMFILMLFGAFMVNSYLGFAATNEFKISYMKIGPTEVRIIFILVNTAIILFGKTYTAPAIPFIMILALIGLIVTVYRSQKYIWNLDMKIRKKGVSGRVSKK